MYIISFFRNHVILTAKITVSLFLIGVVLCFTSIQSCNISPSQLVLLSGDYTTPQIDSWKMERADKLNLYFSRSVSFPELMVYEISEGTNLTESSSITASFTEPITDKEETSENEEVSTDLSNDVVCIPIQFSQKTVVGTKYLLAGVAQDEYGNTLDFTLSFAGYNNEIPAVIFSEIRTDYSKTTTGAKVEFVEFVVLSDGNTAGMQFESGYDGKDKTYIFPNIEVKKGEYIVLHLRTLDDNAISELGDDLLLSGAKDSSAARDLWVDNTSARIGKDDVLLLRNRENGELLDAVMFSRSDQEGWSKDAMLIAAKEAYAANIWKEGFSSDIAAISDGLTLTRTLCRQNIASCIEQYSKGINQPYSVSASDWFVVNTSCDTPGTSNSTERYSE
ncbi:MAG: hypothetical protein BKP49_05495 [Treponema sp. CETP13]|nr:MAG: hypothetical protein BKP49_05495 [Treponema sp. CETP13]